MRSKMEFRHRSRCWQGPPNDHKLCCLSCLLMILLLSQISQVGSQEIQTVCNNNDNSMDELSQPKCCSCLDSFQNVTEMNGTCPGSTDPNTKCPVGYFSTSGPSMYRCNSTGLDFTGNCTLEDPLCANYRAANQTFTMGFLCSKCHAWCDPLAGCRSGFAKDCKECRYYRLNDTCVDKCPENYTSVAENCTPSMPDGDGISGKNNFPLAAVVGGAAGGFVLIVIIIIVVVCLVRSRQHNNINSGTKGIARTTVSTSSIELVSGTTNEGQETVVSGNTNGLKDMCSDPIYENTFSSQQKPDAKQITQGHDQVLRYTPDPVAAAERSRQENMVPDDNRQSEIYENQRQAELFKSLSMDRTHDNEQVLKTMHQYGDDEDYQNIPKNDASFQKSNSIQEEEEIYKLPVAPVAPPTKPAGVLKKNTAAKPSPVREEGSSVHGGPSMAKIPGHDGTPGNSGKKIHRRGTKPKMGHVLAMKDRILGDQLGAAIVINEDSEPYEEVTPRDLTLPDDMESDVSAGDYLNVPKPVSNSGEPVYMNYKPSK